MILSVTFVPAAVALFLKGKFEEKESPAVAWARKVYGPALTAAMHNRELTVTLAVVIMVLSGLLTTRMGSEFVPSLNEGDIALHATAHSRHKPDYGYRNAGRAGKKDQDILRR